MRATFLLNLMIVPRSSCGRGTVVKLE